MHAEVTAVFAMLSSVLVSFELDWADAYLAILSGRDKDLKISDPRSGVPDSLTPAERDGHFLSGQVRMGPSRGVGSRSLAVLASGT